MSCSIFNYLIFFIWRDGSKIFLKINGRKFWKRQCKIFIKIWCDPLSAFMVFEGSLLFSQKYAAGPYSGLAESNPHTHTHTHTYSYCIFLRTVFLWLWMVVVLTLIRRLSKILNCSCLSGSFFFVIPTVAMVTVGYSVYHISVVALPPRSFALSILQTAGN